MGTAPSGWQAPKTDWTASDPVGDDDLNRIEGDVNAVELGSRDIDQSQAPSSSTGYLRQFLDWFANRIKAITGKANWWTNPAMTLQDAYNHKENTSNPHNVTLTQAASAGGSLDNIPDGGTYKKVAGVSSNKITASSINNDAVEAQHISGFGGTGSVSLDNIPEGSTYKYFSGKTLDDLPDGSTYKRLKNANANNHPTRIDNNTQFESEVQNYWSLNATAFQPIRTGYEGYSYHGDPWWDNHLIGPDYGEGELIAVFPIMLPDGVKINEIRFYGKGPYGSGRETWLYIMRAARNVDTWTSCGYAVIDANDEQEVHSSVNIVLNYASYQYQMRILIDPPTQTGEPKKGFVAGIRIGYVSYAPWGV